MRGLGADLRSALRLFEHSPGFALVAVATLAVGIGGASAVFGLVDALLLRGLPYADAGRLVVPKLTVAVRGQGPAQPIATWSYPKFQTLVQSSGDVFAAVGGYRDIEVNFAGERASERLGAELASPSYFAALGVGAALGRLFGDGDGDVAVIADRFWRDRYAGDPSILGRTLRANGHTVTIVGVA